jgi:hypothetical protein
MILPARPISFVFHDRQLPKPVLLITSQKTYRGEKKAVCYNTILDTSNPNKTPINPLPRHTNGNRRCAKSPA